MTPEKSALAPEGGSHPAPAAAPTGQRYGTRRGSCGTERWGNFGNFEGQLYREVGVAETEYLNS